MTYRPYRPRTNRIHYEHIHIALRAMWTCTPCVRRLALRRARRVRGPSGPPVLLFAPQLRTAPPLPQVNDRPAIYIYIFIFVFVVCCSFCATSRTHSASRGKRECIEVPGRPNHQPPSEAANGRVAFPGPTPTRPLFIRSSDVLYGIFPVIFI